MCWQKKRAENKAVVRAVAAKKAELSKLDLTPEELRGKLIKYEKKLKTRYVSMKLAARKRAKSVRDALAKKNEALKGLWKGKNAAEKAFERSETKKALLADKKIIKKKVKSKTTQAALKRKQLKKITKGV